MWCAGLGPLFSCRLWRGDASLACATMRSTTASDSLSILRDTTLDATEYCERASQSTEGVAVLPRVGVAATGTTMLRDLSKSNSSAMAENFACLQEMRLFIFEVCTHQRAQRPTCSRSHYCARKEATDDDCSRARPFVCVLLSDDMCCRKKWQKQRETRKRSFLRGRITRHTSDFQNTTTSRFKMIKVFRIV